MNYCLGCRYCLEGLSKHRCPECGRGFDPADAKTFAATPKDVGAHRLGSQLLSLALIGVVLFFFGSDSLLVLVTSFLLQATVLLVGLWTLLFGSSRASIYHLVAIGIATVVGVSVLTILIAEIFFG